MGEMVTIDVGADFSRTPGGRFRSEGEWSGEEFRTRMVEPLLDEGKSVVVDLDSALGFTTSFLEEVFGGSIRKYGVEVMARLVPRAVNRPLRAQKALMYMKRAAHEATNS